MWYFCSMAFCCFYVLSENAISSAVVQDAVQPQFETWHEGKDIPGRGKKYSARVKALLVTDMKCVLKKQSEFNAAAYCQSVIMQLKSRAVRYFADIAECFADKGAREWNRISKTGGCLLDFARDNHLVDTPRARDFSPLVSKINSNRNQKDQISCIEELRLWRMKLVDLQEVEINLVIAVSLLASSKRKWTMLRAQRIYLAGSQTTSNVNNVIKRLHRS